MARVTGVSRNSGQANPLDQGNIEEPPLARKNAMVSFQFSRKSNEGFGPDLGLTRSHGEVIHLDLWDQRIQPHHLLEMWETETPRIGE